LVDKEIGSEKMKKNVVDFIDTVGVERSGSLRVKAGFDPTAPDLHLGHMVLLKKLQQLQNTGHQVIFLVGDFTAKIGDPTGRSATRPVLTDEEIAKNTATFKEQVFMILDPERTEVRFNSEWWGKETAAGLLQIMSDHTVAALMQREDFKNRMSNNQPVSMSEMVYPLIQGMDSVRLKADIEIGGTDQLFNLHMGRTMQERAGMKPQAIMTMPIICGLDGKNKMSKSLGNHIALRDDPNEIFGKIMSVSDDTCEDWLPLLADGECSEEHPMKRKKWLAHNIVAQLHNKEIADAALAGFEARFSRNQIPEDVPVIAVSGRVFIPGIFKDAGLIKSNGEGLRMISGGALKVDGQKSSSKELEIEKETILSLGKRRIIKVVPPTDNMKQR